MQFSRISLLAAGILAAAVATACSSNDKSDADGADASPTAEVTRTATAAATAKASASPQASATARASATASATASTDSGKDGRDSLLKGLSKLEQSTYHVVYTMSMTEDGQPYAGTFAMAAMGPKSLFLLDMDSADGRFIFASVSDGEKSYFCLGGSDPDAPDEPAQAACFENEDEDGPTEDDFPFFNFEEELRQMALDGEVTVEPAPDRRVGGYESKCWQVTDDTGTGVACVSKADGFLVLIDGDFDEGHVRLEVESYTDKPQDSVFTPPYPVETFASDDNG